MGSYKIEKEQLSNYIDISELNMSKTEHQEMFNNINKELDKKVLDNMEDN